MSLHQGLQARPKANKSDLERNIRVLAPLVQQVSQAVVHRSGLGSGGRLMARLIDQMIPALGIKQSKQGEA